MRPYFPLIACALLFLMACVDEPVVEPVDGTMKIMLIQEATEGANDLILSVELRNDEGKRVSNTTGAPITANISFSGDVSEADFVELPTTISIPKNEKQVEIEVELSDDARFEGDETLKVIIYEASGVEISTSSVSTILVDNDTVDEDPAQYGTPFNVPDTEDMVMYEVNLRAFPGGNIQGVIGKLDHISDLGVNVIWLMPIHPIGSIKSVNSPYSVEDYKEVNPEFGNLEDMRTLVEEAHARGMAVILDWVANHTAWDNDWIDNKAWYTQDVRGQITIPAGTNWQDVADLNFSNSSMRMAMISAMKYWVLAGNVDGFRCDAADFVPKSFWEEAIIALKAIPNRKLIYLAEGAREDHFDAGFEMNYSWDFYTTLKNVYNGQSAATIFTTNTSEYSEIPAGGHKLRFTTNHDESAWDATPVSLFGGLEGSVSAFVIAAYLNGVPLIYGSQEIGVANTIPFFSNTTLTWTQNRHILQAYQALMEYFTGSESLKYGAMTTYGATNVVAFKKQGLNEVLVLVNVRNSDQSWTVPTALQNTTWTNALEGEPYSLTTSAALQPYEYLILER